MKLKYSGLAIVAAMVLNGCAVPIQSGDGQPVSGQASGSDVDKVCNPFVVGLGAAAVCALVAKGNNRVQAGAVCAAVAVTACYLANSYKAEQTRTAKQVEDEYLKRNRSLPANPTVATYSGNVDPRTAVSKGQDVKVSSTIVALPGRSEKSVLVEEELKIVDAKGEAWGKPVRKAANPSGEAGEFQTSFTIPIRDGWSQGVYTVQRTLYLNGVQTGKTDSSAKFQIV
jgi:hypothetical protein